MVKDQILPLHEEVARITHGLRCRPHLEVAIVGHTLVDYALTKALQSHLPLNQKGKTHNTLEKHKFFSKKLTLAKEVEMISEKLANYLECIANIRNEFAHNLFASNFDDGRILTFCQRLDLPENVKRVANWSGPLTRKEHKFVEQEGLTQGIFVVDLSGVIMANASFEEQDIQSNKGRYLTSIKLAWALIGLMSYK